MTVDLSGAHWFKSSYSETSGQCVEIAFLPNGEVGIRDSKHPTGHTLAFTPSEWSTFLTTLTTP
ncbi:hypothetical protein JMUB6875_75820 [Nocardia sp. JMUB6875]|uniref:DUF397 domain-containing protein n=1 Tax=Nocardia sp. JMUB6875 TaxID=3158170 RepID=UPI0032E5A05F